MASRAPVVAWRMNTVSSDEPSVWNQPVGGTLRNRNLRTSVGKPVRYSTQSSVASTICLGLGGGGIGSGSGIGLVGLRYGAVLVGDVRVEDVRHVVLDEAGTGEIHRLAR